MKTTKELKLIWIDISTEEGQFTLPSDCDKITLRQVIWDNTTADTNIYGFQCPNMTNDNIWFLFGGLFYSSNAENICGVLNQVNGTEIHLDRSFNNSDSIRYRIINTTSNSLNTATGLDGYLLILAEFEKTV